MAKVYLEIEDVNRLEKAATCLRDKLLIRVLFHLGCRISEALAITVGDVGLTSGTVGIRHLKQRLKLSCPDCGTRLSRCHNHCPGCGIRITKALKESTEQPRRRILPLDSETITVLKDFIKRNGPVNRNGKLLIFGINRHRAWQIVRACAERAGLPSLVNPETGKVHNVSPHRLRDAFSIHAVKTDDSGDGLRLLQEQLGHQSIATTMRYRKVAGEEHRRWYEKLWSKPDDPSP